MSNKPAIVVCAYNRPQSLQRLLNALSVAVYAEWQVPLVISIDKNDRPEVKQVAENFNWPYGVKTVLMQEKFLGLKEHILACGDLTQTYGSIVLLEDDLFVAPYFYDYACRALDYYSEHNNVAGVSLYNYEVAESCFQPFKPLHDGNDVYFMQVASSWGQAWNSRQWQEFRNWYQQNPVVPESGVVPHYVNKWGQHSWKKHFIYYLIVTQRYFVFPRVSFSTNFEEPGTNASGKKVFQSTLAVQPALCVFVDPPNSLARYDAWFEPEPGCLQQLNPDLKAFDLAVDVYGTKQANELTNQYVLSSNAGKDPQRLYANDFFPLANNVILGLHGTFIGLYETKKLQHNSSPLQRRNLLTDDSIAVSNGVSAIVPYSGEDIVLLNETIESFLVQDYNRKELLIVTDGTHYEKVEALVSYHSPLIRVLKCEAGFDRFQRIVFGFDSAQNELLCWLSPGTVFSDKAFKTIEKVFTDFPTLSAVRGLPFTVDSAEEQAQSSTFPYRLTAGELYKRLDKGEPMPDTQLFFFSKACVNVIKAEAMEEVDFAFEVLLNYNLHVAVVNFGLIKSASQLLLNQSVTKNSLLKYHSLKRTERLSSRLIYILLRLPFFNDGSWQWYYTTLHGFPDVLRYDAASNSYFMSKW